MRVTRGELLHALVKAPLNRVTFLHLKGQGIEQLVDLDHCRSLVTLAVDENRLETLGDGKVGAGIDACRELWRIHARGNRIRALGDAFGRFIALGVLDLSRNELTYPELLQLRGVQIVELSLEGCPELRPPGMSLQEYRYNVLYLLPHVWVLDGQFVSVAERDAGRAFFASPDANRSPPAGCDVDTFDGVKAASSSSSSGNNGGEWCVAGSQGGNNGAFASAFRAMTIREEPSYPGLIDSFRLRALARMYTQHCEYHNACIERQVYCVEERPPRMPRLRTRELLALANRARLDLLIILSVAVQFFVPEKILLEALEVLLAPDVGAGTIADVATLPPFAKSALIFALHTHAREERREAKDSNGDDGYTLMESDLFNGVDAVTTAFGAGDDAPATCQDVAVDDEDIVDATSLRSRHAVILLSRSPAFPPLMSTPDSLPTDMQRTYKKLTPLLRAAGMTHDDLGIPPGSSSNYASPAKRLRSKKTRPMSRNYARPWTVTSSHCSTAPNAAFAEESGALGFVPDAIGEEGEAAAEAAAEAEASAAAGGGALQEQQEQHAEEGSDARRLTSARIRAATKPPTPQSPSVLSLSQDGEFASVAADGSFSPVQVQVRVVGTPPSTEELRNLGASAGYGGFHPGRFLPSHDGDTASSGTGRAPPNYNPPAGYEPPPQLDSADNSNGAFYGIRQPAFAEWVQVGPRLFSVITEVADDGNQVELAPFRGHLGPPFYGNRALSRRKMYWDPRGWWCHIATRMVGGDGHPGLASSASLGRLHRPNKSLHASGLPCDTGVINNVLPALPIPIDNPGGPPLAHPLKLYTMDTTWDANFVLAPPALVAAQNWYARQVHGDAPAGGGSWMSIEESGLSAAGVGISKQFTEHADPLAPVQSAALTLVRQKESRTRVELQSARKRAELLQEEEEAAAGDDGDGGASRENGGESWDALQQWDTLQREMGSFTYNVLPHELAEATLNRPLSPEQQQAAAATLPGAVSAAGESFFMTSVGLAEEAEAADGDDGGSQGAGAPLPEGEGEGEDGESNAPPEEDAIDVGTVRFVAEASDAREEQRQEAAVFEQTAMPASKAGSRSWFAVPSRAQLLVANPAPQLSNVTWLPQRGASAQGRAPGHLDSSGQSRRKVAVIRPELGDIFTSGKTTSADDDGRMMPTDVMAPKLGLGSARRVRVHSRPEAESLSNQPLADDQLALTMGGRQSQNPSPTTALSQLKKMPLADDPFGVGLGGRVRRDHQAPRIPHTVSGSSNRLQQKLKERQRQRLGRERMGVPAQSARPRSRPRSQLSAW